MKLKEFSESCQNSYADYMMQNAGYTSREQVMRMWGDMYFESWEFDENGKYWEFDFNLELAELENAEKELAEEREAEREQYELCRAFAVNDLGIYEDEFEDIYEMMNF